MSDGVGVGVVDRERNRRTCREGRGEQTREQTRARVRGQPHRFLTHPPPHFSPYSLYRADSARLWLSASSFSPAVLVAAALGKDGPTAAAAVIIQTQQRTKEAPPTSVRAALVANPTVRFSTAPCGTGPAARVFITATGGAGGAIPVSPWHDVPLKATAGGGAAQPGGGSAPATLAAPAQQQPLFNFVVEVSAGTTPKLEVSTSEGPLNPLVQDTTSAGAPRFFPAPLFFNYGMLPRTFESPDILDPETGAPGDGDPVDVVEVGGWIDASPSTTGTAAGWAGGPAPPPGAGALPVGSVVPVKVLGALALIDGGELDWKVLAIRASHPAAALLSCVADLEAAAGGACIDRLVDWFTSYKTFEGKPANTWGRGGTAVGAEETVGVIEGAAAAYERAGLGPPSVAAPPGLLVMRSRSRVVLPGGVA